MSKTASPESQWENAPCEAEDTEEMFWLRETDDYMSKVKLGNLLSGQYRFREALTAYRQAERIRDDEALLYLRIGGAALTLFDFPAAKAAYDRAKALGAKADAVAYPMGVWHYLQGENEAAAEAFAACLPAGDAMKIAILYWHALACLRMGKSSELLAEYHPGMKVGHHEPYRLVVSVLAGETEPDMALEALFEEGEALNRAIEAYGLACVFKARGDGEKAAELLRLALEQTSVWPSIACLAAKRETV